ncbi:uncharacterized protein LOC120067616 [Benincasa hispida]|uniref:uncharacterized protein LOC120067616 n=1 Tax=Benincasa hispida TaxID=102211 RepID=UPI0019001013|nr:uncharacterized protein LOC120067616 [Benincasa hispida]
MSSIPRNFALKSISNNLFLRYVPEKNELNGFLQFSSEEVVSPYTKFEIEKSNIGKGYVHIRCCYNNKYWVLQSQSSHYIVATAKEREEDQSKYSCTLFKPLYDDNNDNKHNTFRFQHVYLNLNVHLKEADGSQYQGCLEVKASKDGPNLDREAEFSTFINWDTLFILPKYVAFKQNHYLRPRHHGGTKSVFLEFKSSDPADPGVRNEVISTPDGHVRIKNVPYGKFWIRDPEKNWIVLDDNPSTAKDDPRTLFWPVKLENNVVALRNASNNCFCKRLSESFSPFDNSLNAALDYITSEANLEVTELVLSRNIYNVLFHLSDARTFNERPISLTSTVVENNNSEAQKFSIKLSYEDTTTSTWAANVNGTFGVKMTIDTGVPKVSEGKVEIEAEISEDYTWGKTEQMKCLSEVVHEVTVPAWTKVKASVMATRASCDVPFSYTQRDKLVNGKYITHRYHDGVYNVINSYNFHFVAEEVEEI